jgi:hypothetical protein
MGKWRQQSRPIDRAVRDLDRQIAAVQKQIRQLSQSDARDVPAPATGAAAAANPETSAMDSVTGFVRQMLSPTKKSVAPSYHAGRDLLDIGAEPLRDLEAEPSAPARKPDPDLYSNPERPVELRAIGAGLAPVTDAPSAQEKLAQYLSAGSIKTYRPLKHVQRQARNRFFMWIGLSCLALWLLYAMLR